MILNHLILLGWVIVATISDLRIRKIPNRLTIPGMLCGLLVSMSLGAWATGTFSLYGLGHGFLMGLLGGVTALLLGLLPFSMGWLAGGDIKLLILIGTFVGAKVMVGVMIYSALCGGLIALIFLVISFFSEIKQGKFSIVFDRIQTAFLTRSFPNDSRVMKQKFPYSVAILLGLLLLYALDMAR